MKHLQPFSLSAVLPRLNCSIHSRKAYLARILLMKTHNRISLYFSILLNCCIVVTHPLQAATVEVIVTLHDPVSTYLQKQRLRSRNSISDKLHRKLIAQAQASVLTLRAANHFKLKRQYSYIPALAGTFTTDAITTLQNHPQVASIQLDKPHKLHKIKSTPADALHAYSPYTGKGITVAVLDSGIDTDHPDLADSIVAQHCFSQASCPPLGTNESHSAEDDIYSGGHGTHVAGIITSPLGVAPDASIVAVKVSSNIGIFSAPFDSDILAGLDWIRANLNTQPVHIINLSLGFGAFSNICDDENTAYTNIFQQLRAKGITIFVAAGNEGLKNEIAFPACLNEAIAVGATTISNNIADFSNSNNLLDILAPGVGITSSLIGGGSITQTGTSAATPIAAGVAALMLEANPTLTPTLIETIMENTGVPVADAINGLTFPRIDALAALATVQQKLGQAFDFAAKGYKIDEAGGAVTIEVKRIGNGNGRVSIDYVTVDDTARAGNDYLATSGTLTWENGDISNKSFILNIIDDIKPEIYEKALLIYLQNPTDNIIGNQNTRHQATVTILDDENAGSLEITGISEHTFIDDFFVFEIKHGIEEDSDSITIEVTRKNGNKNLISVDYATIDGTATAGSDYIATQGTLIWNDGDMDNKELTIKLLDDTNFEGKESFTVVLSNPSNGATLDENTQTTVVIADNEHSIGITDSSFESGEANLPHPFWSGGISIRQSPMLSNKELAHTGNNLLILGGFTYPTASFATQSFIIPIEATVLNFWLKIKKIGGTNNDFMIAVIDDNEHFFVTAAQAANYADYQLIPLDIHNYADGNLHDVTFYSEVFGSDTTTTAFLIDDVELMASDAPLECNITSIPQAPQFEVTTNDYHAQATWTTVAEAQGYTFSYAPYSNPISEVTLDNITSLDLGTQTTIAGELASGTTLYLAVQAYNCSGISPYSNLGIVTIP